VTRDPTLLPTDWIARVEQLRRWSRNGERAPHKPLLLLYALGRHQAHGDAPILYSQAEAQLDALLREFGPPRKPSPGYPFHHLISDGLWQVRTADGGGSPGSDRGALRATGAQGRLAPDLIAALNSEAHLLGRLARTLLDENFEPSLHPEICAAVGLDLEAAQTPRFERSLGRARRSAEFRKQVLIAYEYRCALCGYDGMLGGVPVALDAAHVRWWAFDGPDSVDNGICLCALHHKLFDKGVLGVGQDRTITVSREFVARSPAGHRHVLSLVDKPAGRPQPGSPLPDSKHLDWHHRQVFRAPARTAAVAS
jgi:putative restriction endonuclease